MAAIVTEEGKEFFERQVVGHGSIYFNFCQFGDGGGSDATNTPPSENDTALVDTSRPRVAISSVTRESESDDDNNPISSIIIEVTVTGAEGGYTAREVGVFANPRPSTDPAYSANDDVFFLRSTTPVTYFDNTPSFRYTQRIRVGIMNTADGATIFVRPTLTLISQQDVLDIFNGLRQLPESPNDGRKRFLITDGNKNYFWEEFTVESATTNRLGIAGIAVLSDGENEDRRYITPNYLDTVLRGVVPVANQFVIPSSSWDVHPDEDKQPFTYIERGGSSSGPRYYTAFPNDRVTSLYLYFRLPDVWDGRTLAFSTAWTTSLPVPGVVSWKMRAKFISRFEDITQNYGSPVEIAEQNDARAGRVVITNFSPNLPTGGASSGDWVGVELYRDTNDSSDTLNTDALLVGVTFEWSRRS